MSVSEKYEIFCQHYALSRNGTESAKQAGYSNKSAANQASRLLQRSEIQERILEITGELSTNIDVVTELEKQYMIVKSNNHG